MNAHNEEQDVDNNSAYNPFPEPQTIPSGWDMSEFSAAAPVDSAVSEDNSSES